MTKLDDMLSKWPLPTQSQLEADEAAERVVAAVQAGQMPASIDESLLAPPLPKTSDEGQTSPPRVSKPGAAGSGIGVESKMSKDRTRDRTSFQELAKLAQTTPPPPSASSSGPVVPPTASSSGSTGVVRGDEASGSDSGIVDLKAIASADPSGSQRAQTTPLASQGLFEDESAPPKPAVSTSRAAEAVAAPATTSVAPTAPAPTAKETLTKKTEEKKGGGGVVIVLGALLTAGAIAAGGVFYVRSQHQHQSSVATTVGAAPDKGTAKPATTTTAVAGASIAVTDIESPDTIDTSVAQTNGVKPSFRFHAKNGGGPTATTTAAPETTATGGIDPKLIANVPTGPTGGSGGDLSEAMKAAAGGGTGMVQGGGGDQGTKFAPGAVPQRPSQGQVAGAIGTVMPSVKACLGSDDPVSHATVTLQSDGTVKSVSVSGFAAGKPQEACIKAALSKMTVSPFAEAAYPVPVTIRPN